MARIYAGGWVPYNYLDPARGLRAIVGTVSLQGFRLAALAVAALRIRARRSVPHFQLAEADPEGSAPLDLDRAVA